MEDPITQTIIGCALAVHYGLGPGFLESVYQNALSQELRDAGLDVGCEWRLAVRYKGRTVGEFVADMVVEGKVLIEIKAVTALVTAHEAQLVNYLTATGIDTGLLLNFGSSRLQIRRKVRIYQKRSGVLL